MATNSPNYRYRITNEALDLIKSYNTKKWERNLKNYLIKHERLVKIYENKRKIVKMPITINGKEFEFVLESTMSYKKRL